MIGTPKTHDKVETLLKNTSGFDRMVSGAREIHSSKPVGFVTKDVRKRTACGREIKGLVR